MDGPTITDVDAARQFDWPPPDPTGIGGSARAAPRSRPSTEWTDGVREYSGGTTAAADPRIDQPPAAVDRPQAGAPRHTKISDAGSWRRAGVRGAAIGGIAAIAVLVQGSSTTRGRTAEIGTRPLGADAQLLAAPAAKSSVDARHAGGTLTVPGPAGARVWLDGTPRGTAPVAISDLSPGAHEVKVATNADVASQRVFVSEGLITNFVVSTPTRSATRPAPAPKMPLKTPTPGTVAVALPFDVQVFEDGRFAGTNRAEMMLPPGPHRLELVNKSLNYRTVESVSVEPGKAVMIPAVAPMGSLSVNALPWAEVFVDGRRVGETPLGHVPVAVGAHDVVFRHPDFGEQTRSITVMADGPTRLSVDLRR